MTAHLSFPAPRRCAENCGSAPLPKGKKRSPKWPYTLVAPPQSESTWRSHPWTAKEVIEALEAGARFVRGRHDFADTAAERAAGLRPAKESNVGHY